jgi:ectoine hydroxylase-related dioxygenase (phytanoyl-CoA dioxygenase family)
VKDPLSTDVVRRYGVKEQTTSAGHLDRAVEHLRLKGCAVVDGGFSHVAQLEIASAFERAHVSLLERHGGEQALRQIEEHNTIRAPLALDEVFVRLATNTTILSLAEKVFAGIAAQGGFILNQQNGIINPGNAEHYNQGAFHRDLPYQHFVSTRPIAINALYCIEPFTRENGATLVIPGSHREERFPSDAVVMSLAEPVEAPAGHFIVLDCMLFHSGGVNRTAVPRRAVNHVYTLPFVRQQIELPALLGDGSAFPPEIARLLGYGNESVRSAEEYYRNRRTKVAGAR